MVRPLAQPHRPLTGGRTTTWSWRPPTPDAPWQWCRVYHAGSHSPTGHAPRSYGPLYRLDPHTAHPDHPATDPDGRTVIYAGVDLATSACEVFGEAGIATLCPNMRVAILRPQQPVVCFDLLEPGAAMGIGALPALADGDYPRPLTQAWARAIYEDQPTGQVLGGIRYRSGYNGGESLALWDSAGNVSTAVGSNGSAQDLPLNDTRVLRRLLPAMVARRILVEPVAAADCSACRRG